MASEIRDLNGATLVTLDRLPTYPVGRGPVTNVAVGLSVGGKARSSTRGPARSRLRLIFEIMPAGQAGSLLNFLRTYSGGAKAFLLHLDSPMTALADGSRIADGSVLAGGDLRCRYYEAAPMVDEVWLARHRFTCELTEDLV